MAIFAGLVWIPVSIPVADSLTSGFDIDGAWSTVATIAFVIAANGVASIPALCIPRLRRRLTID